jgi:hypothetical protein
VVNVVDWEEILTEEMVIIKDLEAHNSAFLGVRTIDVIVSLDYEKMFFE